MKEIKTKAIILCVDDAPEITNLLNKVLSDHYQCFVATDGPRAIQIANADDRPDLILLDIMMPEMDGFETCRQLKAEEYTKDIPVIFLTGKGKRDDILKGFEIGAVDYVTKPFDPPVLLRRVQTHLELKTAREAAEAASQAKSIFLANMSHEIRTPMNAILGFTEILRSLITDSKQRGYLTSIESSGKSLLNLINEILDLSKVEAGKLELEYAPFSPREVVQDLKPIFSQSVEDKGLDFIIEINFPLPEALILDESRLRQILMNLLGNSVKFTKTGYVKLSVDCQESGDKGRTDIEFRVEDTGIGIPEAEIESILGAFEQKKGQSINEYGGTGLGLAIAEQLTDMMNGKIEVKSAVGKGSTFRVSFNNVETTTKLKLDETRTNKIDPDYVAFGDATVLIADDVDIDRSLIKGYLGKYGFSILEAINGAEAVETSVKQQPDLILMDIKMPVLNGQEATTRLKADEMTRNIPVIAVTGSVMKHTEAALRKLCDGYLRKPFGKQELIEELMKFIDYTLKEPDTSTLGKGDSESVEECSPDDLSEATLARLPELIGVLGENKTTWENLVTTLSIDEVENFGNQMHKFGDEFGYSPLSKWGERLSNETAMFDMDAMSKTLESYPGMIEKLKSI
jgi:signal transduction histidine kinase